MFALDAQECAQDVIYLDQKPYTVGRKIAAGGQGQIHILPEFPGKVLKLLYPKERSAFRKAHLEAIIRRQVPSDVGGFLVASLPEKIAYTADGSFVGYCMPRTRSRLMLYNIWIDPDGYFRHFPIFDRYAVAFNLAEAMDYLHRHNLVIGDVNPTNIVLNMDGTLILCDLDGCSVTDPVTGVRFENSVGRTEYLAPEAYCADLSSAQFTRQSDSFSLAVMIFQIITLGCHPFNAARTDYNDPDYASSCYCGSAEVFNGSPYYSEIPGRTIPPYAKPYLSGLEPFRPLFQRVFGYTERNALSAEQIALRPSPKEWMDALKAALATYGR